MRLGSWPAASRAAGSRIGVPSTHSVVSTRADVRAQSSAGTRKSSRSRMLGEFGGRRPLHAQIQFQRHRCRQRLDQRNRAQAARFGEKRSADARGKGRRREIAGEFRLDAGAQNFHRHAAWRIVGRFGLMHLRDGGRRHGFGKGAEHFAPAACRSRSRRSLWPRSSGNGGKRSCKVSSAFATSLPTISGRVARICPSLI